MTAETNAATAGVGATPDPGRPATDDKPRPDCRHWVGAESRYCREADGVRLFIPGHRCPAHSPNALQGKPETPTGPGWPIHRTEEAS